MTDGAALPRQGTDCGRGPRFAFGAGQYLLWTTILTRIATLLEGASISIGLVPEGCFLLSRFLESSPPTRTMGNSMNGNDDSWLDYLGPITEALFIFLVSAGIVGLFALMCAFLAGSEFGSVAQFVVFAVATSTTIAVMIRREIKRLKR